MPLAPDASRRKFVLHTDHTCMYHVCSKKTNVINFSCRFCKHVFCLKHKCCNDHECKNYIRAKLYIDNK